MQRGNAVFAAVMHKLTNCRRDRLVAALTLLKLLKLAQAFEQAAVVVKLQVYLGLSECRLVYVGLHLLGRNYVLRAAVLAKDVGTVGLHIQHRSAALTI